MGSFGRALLSGAGGLFKRGATALGLYSSAPTSSELGFQYEETAARTIGEVESEHPDDPYVALALPDIKNDWGWVNHLEEKGLWDSRNVPQDVYAEDFPAGFAANTQALIKSSPSISVARAPEIEIYRCGVQKKHLERGHFTRELDDKNMWGKLSHNPKCELRTHLCGPKNLAPTTTWEEKYQMLVASQVVWVGKIPNIALLFAGKDWSYSVLIHYANSVCNEAGRIEECVSGSEKKLIEPSCNTSYDNAAMMPSVVYDDTVGAGNHIVGEGELQLIGIATKIGNTNQNLECSEMSDCTIFLVDRVADTPTAFAPPIESKKLPLNVHAGHKFTEQAPHNLLKVLTVLRDDSSHTMQKSVPILISFLQDSTLLVGGWALDRLVEESTNENLAEGVCVVIPLLTASTYCVYKVTYCVARGLFVSTKWVLQKTLAADNAADITIEASSASTLSMSGQFTTSASPNDHDDYASWTSASRKICWGVRKGCLVAHKVVVATIFTVKGTVGICRAWWNDTSSTSNSLNTSSRLLLDNSEYQVLPGAFPQDTVPVPSLPQPSLPKMSPSKVMRAPSSCRLSARSKVSPFSSGPLTSVY